MKSRDFRRELSRKRAAYCFEEITNVIVRRSKIERAHAEGKSPVEARRRNQEPAFGHDTVIDLLVESVERSFIES
jgi:hypothetical protein